MTYKVSYNSGLQFGRYNVARGVARNFKRGGMARCPKYVPECLCRLGPRFSSGYGSVAIVGVLPNVAHALTPKRYIGFKQD